MIDVETQTVLFARNENTLMSPASMSKLMTLVMVFDALKAGDLSLEEKFFVSENAWRKGGAKSGSSTMFAKKDSSIALKDLLQGITVQSANDACIVIAEGMSGSEAEFARAMTRRAREIGLEKSIFSNSTGWPDKGQKMTAREIARLALYIIRNYPEYYKYFSQRKFTWNGITQKNRNPLLYQNIGADGLKTGHTKESGYGLVASVMRDGRRIVLAINGLESKRARMVESRKMIDWGFRAFKPYKLFDENVIIARAKVWGGDRGEIGLKAAKALSMLMPRTSQRSLKLSVSYNSPLKAPIRAGDEVATLKAVAPGAAAFTVPLYAANSVARVGVIDRGMMQLKSFFAIF